jgi:hypothetical protein
MVAQSLVAECVPSPYVPGLLARREGPILAAALAALDPCPELLLVNATGLDHPRGAGLAVHLGAVVDLPTVGVTRRPLIAAGTEPELRRGAAAPRRRCLWMIVVSPSGCVHAPALARSSPTRDGEGAPRPPPKSCSSHRLRLPERRSRCRRRDG